MSDSFDRELPEEPGSSLDGYSSGGSAIDLPDEGATQAIPTVAAEAPATLSVLTASLQGHQLEFQLTSPQRFTTDIFANSEVHALLIKDPDVMSAIERFTKETASLWQDDITLRPPASADAQQAYSSRVERARQICPDVRALVTPRKNILIPVEAQFNGLLKRLVAALPLPETERKLTLYAGQIHALVRFRQPVQSDAGSPASTTAYTKLLSVLHEEPAFAAVLRSMYTRTNSPARSEPTASGLGAQALTLVDLFCDRFHPDHALHLALVAGVGAGLAHLSACVVQKPVADAFRALLGEGLPRHVAEDHKKRVMVYTDWLDHIVPLEARLRQEGFQSYVTDSLEECLQIHRSKHPDFFILRLSAQPSIVIKAIHYLLSNGVTLTETPTLLLVEGQHKDALASLLAQGIQDILDLEERLDAVILKLKPERTRSAGSPSVPPTQLAGPPSIPPTQSAAAPSGPPTQLAGPPSVPSPHSAGPPSIPTPQSASAGTSGQLSEVSLIELLQTLWSRERTARITLHPPEPSAEALSVYLCKGCITFAELGALRGDAAIHSAMAWHTGNWLVKHVTEDDLPSANTSLSNEAILLEGCRLLEERARGAQSSPA